MDNYEKLQLIKNFIERKRLNCLRLNLTEGLSICDAILNFICSFPETTKPIREDRVLETLKELLKTPHTLSEIITLTGFKRTTVRKRLENFKSEFRQVKKGKKVKVYWTDLN